MLPWGNQSRQILEKTWFHWDWLLKFALGLERRFPIENTMKISGYLDNTLRKQECDFFLMNKSIKRKMGKNGKITKF